MVTSFSQFKKWAICLTTGLCMALCTNAQIGYQISLLNTATGEPRTNETVNVTVTITDSSGSAIWTGTQSVTSNDFGVLSLTVGNADTFTNLDLQQHRLPFYIEVSTNGAMIGKSQILSVPIAEVAKKVEPLKLEDLIGMWKSLPNRNNNNSDKYYQILTFNADYTVIHRQLEPSYGQMVDHYIGTYKFYIDGSNIYAYGYSDDFYSKFLHFCYFDGQIGMPRDNTGYLFKKQ